MDLSANPVKMTDDEEEALSNKFDQSSLESVKNKKMKNCTKSKILKIVFVSVFILAVIAFVCVSTLHFSHPGSNVFESRFKQKLDHFDVSNKETFEQLFFYDNSHWGGPGYPTFLNLGGEGPVSHHEFKYRAWCEEYAREFKALCFILEHR